MNIIPRASQKTDAMTLPADETLLPSLEPILPFQYIVLIVLSYRVWSVMFQPWLWIEAKTWLCCAKHSIETSSQCCFCYIVSKHGTHVIHSFVTSKFSINMQCTILLDMSTMSVSSGTFSRRLSNIILWVFLTISILVISFGRPLWCSFWQVVWPHLNFIIQYFIVVKEGPDSLRVESNLTLIMVGRRPFKWQHVLRNNDRFFPCLQIHREHSLSMAIKQIVNNIASWNFESQLYMIGTTGCFFKQ